VDVVRAAEYQDVPVHAPMLRTPAQLDHGVAYEAPGMISQHSRFGATKKPEDSHKGILRFFRSSGDRAGDASSANRVAGPRAYFR
jgi:hypothetical protein